MGEGVPKPSFIPSIAFGVPAGFDWSKQFYQYANRLAHAYWQEKLNGISTRLVFLYQIGAADVDGPSTRAEWESAVHTVHQTLGLTTMPAFVVDAHEHLTIA
jgi:hypothetical protein